ncbi:hypothetical protein ACO0M4_21365 [Streptomyces sp. RGM 3693]|uniref:hypothetical protein n=1 Tax=Streptomyces sp. RGM 3693 TaxID=3413284 RepID=UPI003D291C44
MSPHQPSPASERHAGAPVAAAGRAEQAARKTPPTMNELLAACAAANAVSTPPDAAEESRAGKRDDPGEPGESAGPGGRTSTPGRDAA